MIKNNDYLASMAIFSNLYNSNHDIYDVLTCFLIEIIKRKNVHSFNLPEISSLLKEECSFNVPDAILKTALKRINFVHKKNGEYTLDRKDLPTEARVKFDDFYITNKKLINHLKDYISEEKSISFDAISTEVIEDSVCDFLLNNHSNKKFSKEIAKFIIYNKDNNEINSALQVLKEGVIIHTGLKYSDSNVNAGSWKSKLVIYFQTEVLFKLVGYDGELLKKYSRDLLDLIFEINHRNNEKTIELKIFKSTLNEIDSFFSKAEMIVEGRSSLNPGRTAMSELVKGCKTKSDVIRKRAEFDDILNKNHIIVDQYSEYAHENNHQYNFIDKSILDELKKEYNHTNLEKYIEDLNKINILRKGRNLSFFKDTGYIIITANSMVLELSWHDDINDSERIPLATDISFLTNKFWYSLNQGFGSNSNPLCFDVVINAKIMISSILNSQVSELFDELEEQSHKGTLTKEIAVASIAKLRDKTKKPEEINLDNLKNILDDIKSEDIESYIQGRHDLEKHAQSLKVDNEKLEEKSLQMKDFLDALKTEVKTQINNHKSERCILKNKKDEKFKFLYNLQIFSGCFILIVYLFTLYYFDWDKMEIYTYLFGLLGAIILYILRRKGVTLDTFPTIMCKKEQAEISNLDEQIRSKSSKLGISKD